jgi:hypothetical protein
MKRPVFLLAGVLLFALNAGAQNDAGNSPLFVSPFAESPTQPAAPTASSSTASVFSLAVPPAANAEFSANAGFSPSTANLFAAASPAEPPQVYGVKPNYDFQAYLGYTFLRFYEVPGTQINTNGFNYGIVYYPDYFKGWLGADGEFVLTFGSQFDEKARFLLGMGGVRVRWAAPRNVEVWGHALAGGSHYVPQTSYGGQGAFGYELGGGVDINTHNSRWAYRIGADVVGTLYFNTYQFSPKFSAGIVYKF